MNPGRGHGEKGHRMKLLRIDPHCIVSWMKGGEIPRMILLSEKLPEDAVIVGAAYNDERGMFSLIIESKEYGTIPPSARAVPEIEVPRWGIPKEA